MTAKTADKAATTSTPEPLAVHLAWAAVMADVSSLAKGDRNSHFNFNFRGIDAVMNAVGPALRAHQVSIRPTAVVPSYRDVRTSRDKPAREVTVLVTYTITGPKGDELTVVAAGESMDDGDKGTAKAMSVAMRVALLQALCLPTTEQDPDAQSYERGNAAPPAPSREDEAARAAEAIERETTAEGVQHFIDLARQRNLLDVTLTFANGPATLETYANAKLATVNGGQDQAAAA